MSRDKREVLQEIVLAASDAAILPVTPTEFVRLATHASNAAWDAARQAAIREVREWAEKQTHFKACAHSWNEPCAMCALLAKLAEMEKGEA